MSDYDTPPDLLAGVERVVVAAVAVTARVLTELGPELTLGQWRVLVLVDRADGMAVGAISAELGAKIAAVSRLVGRLRERGLVETRRSSVDARVVLVKLTPEGRRRRRRIVAGRRAVLARLLSGADLGREAQLPIERLAAALEATK
jgi:DNA-binding MarR family transcriptional regulator